MREAEEETGRKLRVDMLKTDVGYVVHLIKLLGSSILEI